MNVTIAVKEFPPHGIGGTETQTKRMANALADRGHDVTVITKHYGDHEDDGLPFRVLRCWNWRQSPLTSDATFLLIATLTLLRRRQQFDCLQCMMIYPIGVLGFVVSALTGLPYFAWIRGNDFYVAKDVWWKRGLIRRVLADTLVLVQSQEIEQDVRSEFPDREPEIRVLGNGVTVPDDRATLDSKTILFLGRLAPKKGLEYLLRALPAVEIDPLELVIVGDGPERDRLVAVADDLDTPVRFEGVVLPHEVDEYYRRASVFILPSTEGEGLPNAALEAMAWGIPVITTESGGLPSLIDDGQNGYIVPMRSPERLADRVQTLLADHEHRQSLGRAARETVKEQHSWDRIVSELEDIYLHVVPSNSAHSVKE